MMDKASDVIFYLSVLVFGVCLLGVIWIDKRSPIQRIKAAETISRGLWGVSSPLNKSDHDLFNTYSWRKLLLSGVMCASLVSFCTIRRIAVRISLGISLGMLFLWVIFLYVFWYNVLSARAQPLPRDDAAPRQAEVIPRDNEDARLPVTVVTGFLGSGKTTLVKNLLHNTDGMRILVIENEIGESGIDHDLLLQQTNAEDIILMNNGCVCCTVRGDLIKTFYSLFSSPSFTALHWVVIETTGLADPAPVIQSLYMDEKCKQHLRLDAVLTVVDCKHFPLHMQKREVLPTSSSSFNVGGKFKNAIHSDTPEAVQQVAFADRVILNKIDLVTSVELEQLTQSIVSINPKATILTTLHSRISVSDVLNLRAFDLSTVPKSLLTRVTPSPADVFSIRTDSSGRIVKSRVNIQSKNAFITSVNTVSLTSENPINFNAFNEWMVELLREYGYQIYRFKGIVLRFSVSCMTYSRHFVDGWI